VYFNMNAGGAALDTAATSLTITEGTSNNSGTVTLEGIPAFVTINSVPAAGTWSAGATNSTTLTITAQDASEETITGTYATPITLSDPDETNVGTFVEASTCPTLPGSGPPSNVYPSGTSFTFTASGQTAKFCYLGYAEPAQTLTASSTAATAYATFTPGYNTPVEGATSPASIWSGTDAQLQAQGAQGAITYTETGFTNSPYDQELSVDTEAPSCSVAGPLSTFATVVPSYTAGSGSATTFTVTSVSPYTPGKCTISVWDGGLSSAATFTASYTTSGFTVDAHDRN
jgi:hypothetical protein